MNADEAVTQGGMSFDQYRASCQAVAAAVDGLSIPDAMHVMASTLVTGVLSVSDNDEQMQASMAELMAEMVVVTAAMTKRTIEEGLLTANAQVH